MVFLLLVAEISLTDQYKQIFRGKSQSIKNAYVKDNYWNIFNEICDKLYHKVSTEQLQQSLFGLHGQKHLGYIDPTAFSIESLFIVYIIHIFNNSL